MLFTEFWSFGSVVHWEIRGRMCTKSPSNPPPRDFHWIKLFSSWTGQKTRIQKSYNFAHLDPTFTGRDGIRSDCFRGGSKTAFQHLVGEGAVRSDDCSKVGPFFFPFLSAPFTMVVNFFVALQLPSVATSSHPARSSLCPALKVQSREDCVHKRAKGAKSLLRPLSNLPLPLFAYRLI